MTRSAGRSQLGVDVLLSGMSKVFPAAGGETPTIENVDLSIAAGEFVSVLGPSGCGKSTLLRIIAGLEHATAGAVDVGGRPVLGPSPERGVVFQRPGLFPWLDVLKNVMFGPLTQGRSRSETRLLAQNYLAAVGLEGFEHRKVYELSGGMQHRVALARVLINEPGLLLMDEPFAALDAQTRLRMQELLLYIWEADRSTVLFITHDVEEAVLLSDRVVVMSTRPARIVNEFVIDFARPRGVDILASPGFTQRKTEILSLLRQQTLEAERTQGLLSPKALSLRAPARGGR